MECAELLAPPVLGIGTAGWSIPRSSAPAFDSAGTHLQRYGRVLAVAEINSSFYRSHTQATYERWAAGTPLTFRFSIKVPRVITHELALRRARAPFRRFVDETTGLGERRGPLLIQLPPALAFDRLVARRFFDMVRSCYDGPLVCEPRHPAWFERQATQLLLE